MKVPNSMDATLQHFYPYLPPGMVPLSTTDEQAKMFDKWKDETGNEYEVSIRRFDVGKLSIHLVSEWLEGCSRQHTTWCTAKTFTTQEIYGFRVVDVKDGVIVDAPPQCRYRKILPYGQNTTSW